MNEQRLIKSEAEIEMLHRAAQRACEGIRAGMEAAVPGAKLNQVETTARKACLRAGVDEIQGIRLASGSRIQSSTLPPDPQLTINDGDFVYLEITGWAAGYGFDLSRVRVSGNPSAEQIDFMEHLAEATEWMIGNLQPDIQSTFYHTESRERTILPQARGIGLDIEENPWIKIQQSMTPRPGMTLCVEPVVSSNTFGSMTIKEMVVILESGPKILGNLPLRIW